METSNTIEDDLKKLIVEVANLEDLKAEDIRSEEPLFGEGLGLDSIDALELGMAVAMKYGVKFGHDYEENKRHFQTVRTLAELIRGINREVELPCDTQRRDSD